LKATIAKNVTTRGTIAKFSERDRCLFHSLDAESISDALRRTIRQTTAPTLIAATPVVVKALIAVVADVVLTADAVLSMDDSN
jgi:predicted GTPase